MKQKKLKINHLLGLAAMLISLGFNPNLMAQVM